MSDSLPDLRTLQILDTGQHNTSYSESESAYFPTSMPARCQRVKECLLRGLIDSDMVGQPIR